METYYKKPVFIDSPYDDSSIICEFKFEKFTDEELMIEGYVEKYLKEMNELRASMIFSKGL